jgi:hypothetical protein
MRRVIMAIALSIGFATVAGAQSNWYNVPGGLSNLSVDTTSIERTDSTAWLASFRVGYATPLAIGPRQASFAVLREELDCQRGLIRFSKTTYYDKSGADIGFEFAAVSQWRAPESAGTDKAILAQYCPVLPRLRSRS